MYWINTIEKIKTEWEDRIVGLRREEGRGCGENSLGRDVEESSVNEKEEVCGCGAMCLPEKAVMVEIGKSQDKEEADRIWTMVKTCKGPFKAGSMTM